MNEYTQAFLAPYAWARIAYENMLGVNNNDSVQLNALDLTRPIFGQLPSTAAEVQSSSDWNTLSYSNTSSLGALYESLDKAEQYASTISTQINSRLLESESRVHEAEETLKSLRSNLGLSSSTNITVRGGDMLPVDFNPDFYVDQGQLAAVETESVFRLADTGSFSSVRSMGSFAGHVEIDRQLGSMVELGGRQSMVDAQRNTFWMGTHYSPGLIRAHDEDVPWLPSNYQHGQAVEITFYLDRPTMASEIYIDPVTSEPFDLISVGYSPQGLSNQLSTSTFESSGAWTYVNAQRVAAQGVADSYCAIVASPTGYVHQTFDIMTCLARTISGTVTAASSGDVVSARTELMYTVRGAGDCLAGARLVWINASGEVISYKLAEDYPTGFYRTLRLVDYAPALAASGRVELGIFTHCTAGSALFDNATLFVGEQRRAYNMLIDRPRTVSIKNRAGAIMSSRFSFIFAQRNPRKEVLTKPTPDSALEAVSGLRDVDPVLQQAYRQLSADLSDPGPGTVAFAYRIGLKELDLRYREHVPRGLLVTHPLKTSSEPRRMWMTSEFSKWDTDGLHFYIYPYSSDRQTRLEVSPWLVGDVDRDEQNTGVGDMVYVFTNEEADAGLFNPYMHSKYILTDPKNVVENFDGSTRDGQLLLSKSVHLRRTRVQSIADWLSAHGIQSTLYDPNAEVVYGVQDSDVRDRIRAGDTVALAMAASSVISQAGYIPIKLTIEVDDWTAFPETFGLPENTSIGSVDSEVLEAASVTQTTTAQTSQFISFGTWLSTTNLQRLGEMAFSDAQIQDELLHMQLLQQGYSPLTRLTELISQGSATDNPKQATLRSTFRRWYDKLKADGRLQKELSQTQTIQSTIPQAQSYKTKFSPIIAGPGGAYFRLFWYNSTTDQYQLIDKTRYTLDPAQGLIQVHVAPPATAYAAVVASYRYLFKQGVETYDTGVLSYVTDTASSLDAAGVLFGQARTYPVTRNMTDYVNGRVPKLRTPDFDRQSRDYYPVIEYYATQGNRLQLSTSEFFKFGDKPGRIRVEYDSLDLQPRAAVEIVRSGSPTSSTAIDSFSLFVKESPPTPVRANTT